MKREVNVYGVKMTSLEQIRFNKHLDNAGIQMNTYVKEERKSIAQSWLDDMDWLNSDYISYNGIKINI